MNGDYLLGIYYVQGTLFRELHINLFSYYG